MVVVMILKQKIYIISAKFSKRNHWWCFIGIFTGRCLHKDSSKCKKLLILKRFVGIILKRYKGHTMCANQLLSKKSATKSATKLLLTNPMETSKAERPRAAWRASQKETSLQTLLSTVVQHYS